MSKYAKAVVILLMLLNGCVKQTTPEHLVVFEKRVELGLPVGKVINSPLSSIAVAINPLTFERVPAPSNPDVEKIIVHGLKDKTFEDQINKDIQTIYDRLLSYTKTSQLPYRGILELLPQSDLASPRIDFTPTFNFNNLLSIVASGSYPYTDKTGQSTYVTIVDTLNYDLSTGRKLTIADLFTNDADIKGLLNAKVNALIRKTSSEYMDLDKLIFGYYQRLEQVSPFSGVQGNQVFALNEAGVQLVFDYRTPEFNTFGKAFQYDISYASIRPYFAADRRFINDNTIYADPIKNHRFLYDTDYLILANGDKQITVDGHTWYFNLRYPQDLDAFYMTRILTLQNESHAWALAQHLDSIDYMSNYIYAHTLGKFTLIDSSTSVSSSNWGVYLQDHECYVDKKIVTLKQIFTEGFDYEALIKPKIMAQLSYFDASLQLPGQYAEYRANLKFTLNETSLILDTFATSPTDQKPYPIQVYIPYDEIGGEKLTLFD